MSSPANLDQQAAMGPQSDKCIDIPQSVSKLSSLAEFDQAGKGYLDASDVRIAIHQMRLMRKALLFMGVFSVVLVIGMFASSFMAIQLAKDMSVQKGRLVDSNGHGVSTVQQVDFVTGISDVSRRLNETSTILSETEGELNIGKAYFQETLAGFLEGKTEWVASLPDGSKRKVTILGSEEKFSWGFCGTWPYLVEWIASCPVQGSTECVIKHQAVAEMPDSGLQRLLKGRAEVGTLEGGEAMQRALQGKMRPAYY